MNSPEVVDFENLASPGIRVFAGRERGRQARVTARLDELDKADGPIVVRIPEDTISVSSSFFLGMFTDSITRLGEERFRLHYRFEGRNIKRVVEDGIREALSDENPLN